MTLLEAERQKYQRMWDGRQYRRTSAGMRHVKDFLFYFSRNKGDTLIDLGCGMGWCGEFFSKCKQPFNVTLFDFVDAREVDLPFIEGNVWDHDLPIFDWVFCSDVLEHIPPEHVDATLDGIKRITRKGAMICVCHIPSTGDEFDMPEIGPLHLSVHPREWWQPKIEERWELKYVDSNWKDTSFFVGPPCEN